MAERNLCTADSLTRIVLGIVFIILGVVATPWINFLNLTTSAWYIQSILSIFIGLLFVRAGLTKCCPINKLLGLNTHKKAPIRSR
ncbi:MAG TPA: DUF2892 domain-containing protein [Candidatus Nanoarchaeia archaeon]|nr:DUF2892 domain-containing protein [Candidatus Nanoarchaeia archaeon]